MCFGVRSARIEELLEALARVITNLQEDHDSPSVNALIWNKTGMPLYFTSWYRFFDAGCERICRERCGQFFGITFEAEPLQKLFPSYRSWLADVVTRMECRSCDIIHPLGLDIVLMLLWL